MSMSTIYELVIGLLVLMIVVQWYLLYCQDQQIVELRQAGYDLQSELLDLEGKLGSAQHEVRCWREACAAEFDARIGAEYPGPQPKPGERQGDKSIPY